ncbi:MAG: ribosome biogenesis factor YjgA [Betaproteobacteria bacterium]
MPRHAPPDDETEDTGPSKTRRKHEMQALQDLGEALIALDPKRIALLELPDRLADAIATARTITAHEGRRRQIQFIGKLMRTVDPEPVRAAIALWTSGSASERILFAQLERWRERVLADDAELDALMLEFPGADRSALATLIADARNERARGGPPHRYRELFRVLKTVVSTPATKADAA